MKLVLASSLFTWLISTGALASAAPSPFFGPSCESLFSNMDVATMLGRLDFDGQTNYHAERRARLKADMIEAGLTEGPAVVTHTPGAFEITTDFSKVNPANKNERYVVRAVLSVMELPQKNAFMILNFEYQTVGFVPVKDANGDPVSVTHFIADLRRHRSAFERQWYQGTMAYFDKTQRNAWINHVRRTLETVLLPLAMRDPGVVEIGLGFDASQHNHRLDPRLETSPVSLQIGRMNDVRYSMPAPRELLPVNDGPSPRLAGVDAVNVQVTPETYRTVEIPDRSRYVVVYDEMLDQNPEGNIYAVHRQTGEKRPLYFNPSRGVFTFEPAKGAQLVPMAIPFQSAKLNGRLNARMLDFEKTGRNPRISVSILFAGRAPQRDRTILSMREIRALAQKPEVVSISEYDN